MYRHLSKGGVIMALVLCRHCDNLVYDESRARYWCEERDIPTDPDDSADWCWHSTIQSEDRVEEIERERNRW